MVPFLFNHIIISVPRLYDNCSAMLLPREERLNCLPRLRSDLECLREVWNTWRAVQEQHTEWKRGRWQRINTKLMKKATEAQIDVVTALPVESHEWDVYVGMHHAILDIQVT